MAIFNSKLLNYQSFSASKKKNLLPLLRQPPDISLNISKYLQIQEA